MIITSQAPAATRPIASAVVNVATLGFGEAVRSGADAKAERADHGSALTDMRLTGRARELVAQAFPAAVVGTVVEDAKFRVRSGRLERQYTLVRMPQAEVVLLQIPGWILKDGNQIDSLDVLVYALRGKTVRIFSADLPGEPSSWFDGLKRNWEEDESIRVDYISQARVAELEQGEGDLGNVLKLDLRGIGAAARREPTEVPAERPAPVPSRKVRIFLASSEELRADRDSFDLYFRQLNDELLEKGQYLEIHRWENFLDAMSETRLQDEYNKAVRDCDVFVSLFFTRTGRFTEEEFDTAHGQFKQSGRPLIYTFFKTAAVDIDKIRQEDLVSLRTFQKKLADLGHFYTRYDSIDSLKLQFRNQLDRLLDGPLR